MALLSGEVETSGVPLRLPKHRPKFRMALLSGEVETLTPCRTVCASEAKFRMALLSGEVETAPGSRAGRDQVCVPDGFAIRGS